MKRKVKDIESMVDTIGINLNAHLNFGIENQKSSLTSVLITQDIPESIVDNIEQKI